MRIFLSLLFLAGLVVAGFFFFVLNSEPQLNDIDLICGELAIGFGALVAAVSGGSVLISDKLYDIREIQRDIATQVGVQRPPPGAFDKLKEMAGVKS